MWIQRVTFNQFASGIIIFHSPTPTIQLDPKYGNILSFCDCRRCFYITSGLNLISFLTGWKIYDS